MAKVNTSYFLAQRLRTGEGGRKNSVMVRIATLSVVIGLAVMIVSLAVINGFKYEISDKLTGAMAHVRISHWEQAETFESEPISASQSFSGEIPKLSGFAGMSRYAHIPAILRGEESFQGIVLKGVGGEFNWTFFERSLTEGVLPVVGDSARNREVLLSKRLADMMQVGVGDRIELMFLQDPPRRNQYQVTGLYQTGMPEVDNRLIMTDIRNVQRMNRWEEDQISGFEIWTTDFNRIRVFSDAVYNLLIDMNDPNFKNLMVTDLKESNPLIFDWLETHNLNALIVIIVMLMVAVFNMIAAMLIILLEKTSLIGILKALGMNNGAIQRVFIYRSSYIILKGMLWGNVVGLALCFLQKQTGWLTLDADGYFLTTVPIHIDWWTMLWLNAGVFGVIVLMQVLPTRIVSRVRPEKTIRFE